MKFSIIIPIYNVKQYLDTCIESVIAQEYSNFQLILVDDGSGDGSGLICDEYAKRDDRIQVIHQRNSGQAVARNVGIQHADGEYVIFLDADDCWRSTKLLEMVQESVQSNNLVIWKYEKVFDNNNPAITQMTCKKQHYTLETDWKYLLRSGLLFAAPWYMAIPRTWFVNDSLIFESGVIAEDVEWFARLLLYVAEITVLDAPLYGYRIRKNSTSNSISEKMVKDLYKHLHNIEKLQIETDNLILQYYLAEQTANFVIVLSRWDCERNGNIIENHLVRWLKYTLRVRSKVLSMLMTINGVSGTRKILKYFDRR